MRQVLAGCVHSCPLDLVRVVVQTDDVTAREGGDLARRLPNAAAYIQDGHVLSDAHAVGEIVLVAGQCLQQ